MMKMLSNEEGRQLLQGARVARLDCIVNDEPYVVGVRRCLQSTFASFRC